MCWNHTCPSHWESVVHIFLFILTTSILTWVPYSGGIAQPFAMFPSLLFSSSYKILPGLSSWKSSLSIFLHSFKPPLYLHSLHTKTQMRLGSFPRSLPVSPWLGAELEDWSCFLFHFIHLFNNIYYIGTKVHENVSNFHPLDAISHPQSARLYYYARRDQSTHC